MALVDDVYISGLVQSGPPPGANDDVFLITQWYRKNAVIEVKAMASRDTVNVHRLLLLTGQDSAFDGLLQGVYCYVPQSNLDPSRGDDASYIVVNDGKSAWQKLT